jgi:hypothetical protein
MSGNQQPPANGNITVSNPGAVSISLLFALALFLYGLRIYTRVHPTFKLSAVDYIISVAFVRTCGRYLVGDFLMFLIDMRIDCIYQFYNSYMLWLRTLQLLHLRRCSNKDP